MYHTKKGTDRSRPVRTFFSMVHGFVQIGIKQMIALATSSTITMMT